MQIEIIDIIYGIIISGIVFVLVKYINTQYFLRDKKCIEFNKTMKHHAVINNDIEKNVVRELYALIEKYFSVRSCYLSPDNKIKEFYDLSSFDLHENYEDFVEYMLKHFKVEVKIEDELIDLLIGMARHTD